MAQRPISGQQLESASKALFNQSQWAQYGQGAVKQLTAAEQAIANQRIAAEMRAMGYGQKPVAATGAAGAGLAGYLGTLGGATLPQIAGMGAGAMGIAGAGIAGAGLAGYAAGTALDNLPRAWGGEKISETLGGAMAPMFDKGPRQTNIPENLNQLLAESPNPASQQALGSISGGGGGAVEGVPFNGQKEENNGLLPSYDDGTKYVPEDQLAQLHKGEMIVPADQNPYNDFLSALPLDRPPRTGAGGGGVLEEFLANSASGKREGLAKMLPSALAPSQSASSGFESLPDVIKQKPGAIEKYADSLITNPTLQAVKPAQTEEENSETGKLTKDNLAAYEAEVVAKTLPASQRIDQLVGKLSKEDESRGWRGTMSDRAKELEALGVDTTKIIDEDSLTDLWRKTNEQFNKSGISSIEAYSRMQQTGKSLTEVMPEIASEKMEDSFKKYSWYDENQPEKMNIKFSDDPKTKQKEMDQLSPAQKRFVHFNQIKQFADSGKIPKAIFVEAVGADGNPKLGTLDKLATDYILKEQLSSSELERMSKEAKMKTEAYVAEGNLELAKLSTKAHKLRMNMGPVKTALLNDISAYGKAAASAQKAGKEGEKAYKAAQAAYESKLLLLNQPEYKDALEVFKVESSLEGKD